MTLQFGNHVRYGLQIVIVLLAGMWLDGVALAQNPGHTVAAGKAGTAIRLDGILDEPAWQSAGVIELTQQSPEPGQPTPFHTKALLLHDSHTLYVAFINDDPDVAAISTSTMKRDDHMGSDDRVTVVLDTFNTQRSAYVFAVNALGAMADGLLAPGSSGGRNPVDNSWNGIWHAAVHRTATGWTAVMAIDLQSLQFNPDTSAWGFNASREVPREQLTLNWSGITLDSSVYNLPREGRLTGLAGIEQGAGLDFRPYGLVQYQSDDGADLKGGFDLRYNFSPSLAGLLTYNTDFSQAQPDHQRINTTRFALSFPETRQFFLEGSQLFTFGLDLTGGAGTTFIPYQSRQIGLLDGETVPLRVGVKLLGQSSAGSLGLLGVHMGPSSQSEATDLFVGRGAWNATDHLQVGTLVTHGDPIGTQDNTFAGADAVWKTSNFRGDKNLNLFAWTAKSHDNLDRSGSDAGYGAGVDYPNDLWQVRANINVYGETLNPGLGFLPRPGTRQYYLELNYKPRPQSARWDWIEQFFWHGSYKEVDGIDGGKQSSEYHFYPNFTTVGGYHYSVNYYREYDAPPRAFEIGPNVMMPAGQYQWDYYALRFNTPRFNPFVLEIDQLWGGYYNGTMQHPSIELDWNLFDGRLQLSASQEMFYAYLPQGNFKQHLSTFGTTYSFSPDFYITSFAQYSDAIPGVSIYTKLHWIVNAASNIYLVWNHGLVTETTGIGRPVVASGDQLTFKVQWDFR